MASAQTCGGYFDPCTTETLTFEYPRTVRALQVIHITGLIDEQPAAASKASDDTVEFVLANQAIGSAPVAADGTFEGDFTVPNVPPAEYDITATSGTLSTTGPITVIADGVSGGNGNNNVAGNNNPLARTGFDATPMVTLGAAVLVLGAAAVYGSKRRRIA
ncbi:MAG TPA: LPXTG cell wall anchor domain-containing protein [Acidimicrobiales bacterium]|nr:LPXTG cell wall anchor domain-containing protein [Acidimicrobiales bacterium]